MSETLTSETTTTATSASDQELARAVELARTTAQAVKAHANELPADFFMSVGFPLLYRAGELYYRACRRGDRAWRALQNQYALIDYVSADWTLDVPAHLLRDLDAARDAWDAAGRATDRCRALYDRLHTASLFGRDEAMRRHIWSISPFAAKDSRILLALPLP